MPIKSYIAHPYEGKHNELIMRFKEISSCEIIPAINQEIIIIVTDTYSKQEDQELYEQILLFPELKHLSLVSGFNDQEITN